MLTPSFVGVSKLTVGEGKATSAFPLPIQHPTYVLRETANVASGFLDRFVDMSSFVANNGLPYSTVCNFLPMRFREFLAKINVIRSAYRLSSPIYCFFGWLRVATASHQIVSVGRQRSKQLYVVLFSMIHFFHRHAPRQNFNFEVFFAVFLNGSRKISASRTWCAMMNPSFLQRFNSLSNVRLTVYFICDLINYHTY